MSSIHLILGGIRSGKSAYAERLAAEIAAGRPVIYIATGAVIDDEMAERVRRHRERRPSDWRTVEASLNPVGALREAGVQNESAPVLLLDSLDGWVSNLLIEHEGMSSGELEGRTVGAARRFASYVGEVDADAVMVSSEVGHSPVATSSLGRQFQDLLGTVNQAMAADADAVTLVVAGVGMRIKPTAPDDRMVLDSRFRGNDE